MSQPNSPRPMKLPFFDLTRQIEPLKSKVMVEFERLVTKQSLVLGDTVANFENDLAKWIGVKHAITVANGTDALIVGLRALGVGFGDEVISTPFSFFASTSAICAVGAKPVFVDILPDSFNIDPSLIEKAITSKTKVIMPVHLYGQCADMGPIMEIARKHKLKVLEDFAQSIGAEDGGKQAGSIGDIGATSFYPTKNLGAAGEAGAVTTNDDALAERMKWIRVHGGAKRYMHDILGMNSRLDALQCAYLHIKLPYLRSYMDNRAKIADRYNEELKGLESKGFILPKIRPGKKHIWNQYIIRVPDRDNFKNKLAEMGIPTDIYYPMTIPQQKAMRGIVPETGWAISEKAAKEVLALPIFPELRGDEQAFVIEALKK